MPIRCSSKAVIIHGGKILLVRCRRDNGDIYYDLPGGGQHQYEAMEDAAVREVLEETGYRIAVTRLMAVDEEIYTDEKLRVEHPDYTHRIKHIFKAELLDIQPDAPTEIDYSMQGCEWIALSDLARLERLHPQSLRSNLFRMLESEHPLWLGSEYLDWQTP